MSSPKYLAMAVVLLLVTGCVSAPAPSPETARAELQQRQAGFLMALDSKDAAMMAAYFAEDAVMQVANMPVVQGRAAIEKFYGNIVRFLSSSTAKPEALVLAASADLAYGYGTLTNVFDGQQGRTEFPGKYLLVWQKRAGNWWVVAYSISGDRTEARR